MNGRLEHRRSEDARRPGWENSQPTCAREFSEREKFFCYVQWIADEQWHEVRKFAEERGVALMGDIPFGVSYYSADVFSEPRDFPSRLVGGRAARAVFQRRRVHDEMGTKLGHPGL